MIAQQLTTRVGSINVARDIANGFYRSRGLKPIPILFKEIAGASGAFSTRNLCIYISPSFIERLKRYSEIRAFHEFYQTVRHELEHYKSYTEGARTYTKEIERHADKVSLIEATEALNRHTDEEINPLLEGAITGLGFGAGLAASGLAVKRMLGGKNPVEYITPSARVFGKSEWLKQKEREYYELIKDYFRGARLVNGIWINRFGKKFAYLGDYPGLEPTMLRGKNPTYWLKKYCKSKGGKYTREVKPDGTIIHRCSYTKNPTMRNRRR